MYVKYTMCMLGTHGGQKRELDNSKLELKIVVSHHVGSRNKIQSSARATSTLNHCVISPVQGSLFWI